MKYRQFFSTLALTIGSTFSLGLVLSIPATFSVKQTFAATSAVTLVETMPAEIIEVQTTVDIILSDVQNSTSHNRATLESKLLSIHLDTNKNVASETKPELLVEKQTTPSLGSSVFTVPFFSQLTDITEASWKKVGCGITGLAMLIEYYYPGEIDSVDTLLHEGVALGAYDDSVGWSYSGLISVAQKYGVTGTTHDYKGSTMEDAFAAMKKDLADGPIMASVHYTFKPTNPIPHLVIISGIKNNLVYYNDPADTTGGGSISIEQFKSGWKKRYIEFYPVG